MAFFLNEKAPGMKIVITKFQKVSCRCKNGFVRKSPQI